jgi:hypothetical protein
MGEEENCYECAGAVAALIHDLVASRPAELS